MNIQTKYDVGDTAWHLYYGVPRQVVIEEVHAYTSKDKVTSVEYDVFMPYYNCFTHVLESELYDDEGTILLQMAEELEAKAKTLREQAGIVQQQG